MTTPQPPGWYPDPTGQPQSRYWDGRQWSSSTQPRPAPRPPRRRGLLAAVVLVPLLLLLVGGALGLRLLGSSDESASVTASPQSFPGQIPRQVPPAPVTIGPCTYTPERAPARPVTPPTEADLATSGTYDVVLATSVGRVSFEADAATVPCALTSLRSLARQGYFDGSPCHRLTTAGISVLQCGDPTGTGSGGPGYAFDDEALEGATYPRGTVAMANSGPSTNGSQFFLVYEDSQLAPDYTPVGRITAGLDLLQRVAAAGVAGGGSDGPPATPVLIETLTVRAG